MNKNFYDIFGIKQNSTQDEIKEAYRKIVKEYHPDKFQDEFLKEKSTRFLQKINFIYSILSDPKQRKEYDDFLNVSPQFYENEKYNNDAENYKKNYENNHFKKKATDNIFLRVIGFIFLIIILSLINSEFKRHGKETIYKEEIAQLKILEEEIKTLETELNIIKAEVEKDYSLEKKKVEINSYENKLNFLKRQYNLTKNIETYYEYDRIFKLYDTAINDYNLYVDILEKKREEFNSKVEIRNKKAEEYNQILSKIKH